MASKTNYGGSEMCDECGTNEPTTAQPGGAYDDNASEYSVL